MGASFSFHVDPEEGLVRITLSACFGPGDFLALAAERIAALGSLTCPPSAHVSLVDVRELEIRSQATIDAFETLLSAREYRPRRLALLVAQTPEMARVQRALAARPGVACFTSPYDAVAWLLDDGADSAPLLRAVG